MWIQLQHILVPFIAGFFSVAAVALAIGMLPALWVMARGRQYRYLWRWTIVAAMIIAAAVYGLPKGITVWIEYAGTNFRPVAMWMGIFVGVLFAPMLIPEPLRLARSRIRHERERPHIRRVRHKRRKQAIPRDLNLR